MILLQIFAAPILQVIGYFFVICVVAWGLWQIYLKVSASTTTPPILKTVIYWGFVVGVVLMILWWCSFTFGLGIF